VDKRKIAPKERLQALTSYCQQLETLLTANGIDLPPPPPMHVQSAQYDSQATSSWLPETPLAPNFPLESDQPDFAEPQWPGELFPHVQVPRLAKTGAL
jgi:hypothetical protein